MKKLKLLDTFSGIGGFSYAAEKLVGGFETTQFIEIDPYCQKVLKKHWPNVPIHDDIRTFTAEPFQFDAVCGGFPCQDISTAGKGKGITEESRSGLFYELIRVIRMVRPRYVILENVAAILNNGLDIVLGELSQAGYDAEWAVISASSLGACHRRSRWWLVAYPNDRSCSSQKQCSTINREDKRLRSNNENMRGTAESGNVTDSDNNGSSRTTESRGTQETNGGSEERKDISIKSEGSSKSRDSRNVQLSFTDTESIGHGRRNDKGCKIQERQFLSGEQKGREVWNQTKGCNIDSSNTKSSDWNGNENEQGDGKSRTQEIFRNRNSSRSSQVWKSTEHRLNPNWRQYVSEPCLLRGNDGLSNRVDRLRALGNSVVPEVAAIPLQRVKDIHEQLTSVDR